ncbi:YggS family pyridoxal phosphate-dependent enzyme [Ruminiclostridium cellobioparum]|uniref:Pyridoxal phosphate homeostasis protein n=1 Tax=Ruminiclostridium cellobioparum subsp. termitidis CT1112 TaxID=1195236 RepID=S0FIG8_RUMCE|nr:YggS family pyridoxal phosphate-dependent enzyme [Ruminiclostridium cellobioparum]EMS71770.1 pyridoxal phosphate enzyme, YggS family [Ruminiclostridium cellobioparum subsp. termitidis CT1112]
MIDTEIKSNLDNIFKRVGAAAERSGRTMEDIRVIAVTKTVEADRIKNVYEYGLLDMGENRVQELTEKYDKLPTDCKWHLIGHLQTNKVKYIIDKVEMIHSVDSMELAKEINSRAAKHGRKIDILLQVNVSGEDTKFGISPGDVDEYVGIISRMENISLRGLMTIAPFTQDPQVIRPVFRNLYNIYIDIKHKNIDNVNMDYLSMGMSNDFEIAIEEGANIVRIGTGIFGKRDYTKK